MKRSIKIIMLASAICCITSSHAQTSVKVKKTGTLEQMVGELRLDTFSYLTIEGKLNSADIRMLRQMAGYADEGGKVGRLECLDLKDVEFVDDKCPFMTLDAAKEHLAGTALPGKVKAYEQAVDRNLLATQRTDYDSYRDRMWRWKYEQMDQSVIWMRGLSVLYYYPRYFLGHDSRKSIQMSTVVMRNDEFRHGGNGEQLSMVSRNSEGEYFFADGIGHSQWKEMKRRKILRFPGHRIEASGSKYTLSVSSVKGKFFHDTFYKCPSLRVVMLPRWATIDYTLVDETSRVEYWRSSPTMVKIEYINKDWQRKARDHVIDLDGREPSRMPKSIMVSDRDDVERLIGSLQGLKRIYGNRDSFFRIKMTIYHEGSDVEDIYFCDEYHVKHLNDGSCHATDERLLDALVDLKVMKPYKDTNNQKNQAL